MPDWDTILYRWGSLYYCEDHKGNRLSAPSTDAALVARRGLAVMGNGVMHVKSGTYNCLSTETIPGSSPARTTAINVGLNGYDQTIKGAGLDATTFYLGNGVGGNVISFEDRSGGVIGKISLQNFTVDGNKAGNTSSGTDGDNCGLRGRAANNHFMQNIEVKNCAQQGVYVTNCQSGEWNFIYAQDNDEQGMEFDSEALSDLIGLHAYENGDAGIRIVGGSTRELAWINLVGGEAFGNGAAVTAPGLQIQKAIGVTVTGFTAWRNGSAANRFDGIYVNDSQNVDLLGCNSTENYRAGVLFNDSTMCNVIGGKYYNNRYNAVDAAGAGVYILDSDYIKVAEITAYDDDATSAQNYGVAEAGTSDNNTIIYNDLRNNATGPALIIGASTMVRGNRGYITESKGTGSIANGATSSGNIAHGLSYTPAAGEISILWTEDPTNALTDWWVSGIDGTNFVINRNDPGASGADFGWSIRKI